MKLKQTISRQPKIDKHDKPQPAWVIMNTKSGMLHFTLRTTKLASIEELCHNYCMSWKEALSDGYYAKKVFIVPVASNK